MSLETTSLAIAILLWWIAVVHAALAFGFRRGELVWSGRQPRLLAPDLRLRSGIFAFLLVVSGWVLGEATGAISTELIPERYVQSATFAVTAFLGVYFIYTVFWGTRWERAIFAPITLAGALLAGWLTFA